MVTSLKRSSGVVRVKTLYVRAGGGDSGILSKAGQHVFAYSPAVVSARDQRRAIALAMPVRPESYQTTPMLPIFQTSLAEGFLKERIVEKFSRQIRMDDMALLALSGQNRVGRIHISAGDAGGQQAFGTESLKEILEAPDSKALFEELCDKYLIASGIAGVQPKVVVDVSDDTKNDQSTGSRAASPPELMRVRAMPGEKAWLSEKSSLRTRSLIIKVSGDDFPMLPENEFHCLEIARSAGLPVPRTWLSDDRKRLAIERFDIDATTGTHLGFEDMVSLQGRINDSKYEGSYENIAQTIVDNASPAMMHSSLADLFASLVLSVVVRNGDAHLKNFGLLYTDPSSDDCRLSPTYDVVCTRVYIQKDQLALSLAKSKGWPTRRTLAEFGRRCCQLHNPDDVIGNIVETAMQYRPDEPQSPIWAPIRAQIEAAALSLSSG